MFKDEEGLDSDYFWKNSPKFEIKNHRLFFKTSPDTDFWQKTHYGFRRDNGHCLLKNITADFSLSVRTEFYPKKQYDQCGLIVRIDSENWIKTSIEYETSDHSRLGSVVTNLGYSDWATLDIHSKINTMWYRIQNKENDFLLEYSENGMNWKQLRMAHLLLNSRPLAVGIYACSPMESSFECVFDHFELGDSEWPV
ncbi:hypothetical protein A0128_06580 [Leptospira tipperaryensis]|uniref:DUF1349 domain-containing protein n=1 Tax=Leptospira tipperaryensis TaxID=2564040 RepID=A0A1D7UVA8_9LEPT|nr:DUF1349 domain-containing protein [Leptospira tipperaryensis]AOP33540.1 hypothetical protein A0128_06580 [Leptospira tipperaryensis]